MKVELERAFSLPATPDVAWAFLQDIEGVAGCMPGARITERIDATHFKGTISVRVGPAAMAFKGDIEVRELDVDLWMLHLVGKGSDTTGSSGASMDLVARIEANPADGLSQLVGRSEVTMSGKAAAFGGRMMGTVADQILKQFAANFAAQVQARAVAMATAALGASTAGPANVATAAPGTDTPRPTDTATAAPETNTARPLDATAASRPTAAELANAGTATLGTRAPGSLAATAAELANASIAASGTRTPSSPAATAQPAATATPTPNSTPTHASPPTATSSAQTNSSALAPPPAPAPTAAAAANELNALALLWAIIRDWFRSLFRRRPA